MVDEYLLIEGEKYFLVWYVDDAMQVPDIETHIFVGKNIFAKPDSQAKDAWYFQDPDSYLNLGLFSGIKDKEKCKLLKADRDTLESIYDLDGLILELHNLASARP